jgi:hypothetical protein
VFRELRYQVSMGRNIPPALHLLTPRYCVLVRYVPTTPHASSTSNTALNIMPSGKILGGGIWNTYHRTGFSFSCCKKCWIRYLLAGLELSICNISVNTPENSPTTTGLSIPPQLHPARSREKRPSRPCISPPSHPKRPLTQQGNLSG